MARKRKPGTLKEYTDGLKAKVAKRSKPVVPRVAWALVKPDGRIDVDTVASTRRGAICSECCGMWDYGWRDVWASHRKQGWRVVKVEIREAQR